MTDINLLFRQAFEYSILEVSPKKFAKYVFDSDHTFPIEKTDFDRMRTNLIENIAGNTENSNKLLVDSENLRKLNLDILDTIAGKTVLHSAGKKLGDLIGNRVKEIDFKKYIFEINSMLESLRVGKIRVKKFDHSIVDFVLLDNVFSRNLKKDQHICHFMSGFFQGILEEYSNTHWNVVETKCSARGDEYCEFQARNI